MDSYSAEKSVIASLIHKPSLIDDMISVVSFSDFESFEFGVVYKTICDMASENKEVDIILMSEVMAKNGILDQIGGMSFLSDIAGFKCSTSNAMAYCKLVKDKSDVRVLRSKIDECQRAIDVNSTYEEACLKAGEILETTDVNVNEYLDFKSIVKSQVHELDERFKSGGGFSGLKTGFDGIDSKFMGLREGDYWVIGARPSMGKTAFSLNLCANLLREKKNILYFSVESTKESLVHRMLTSATGISSGTLRSASLQDGDWPKLSAGVQQIKDFNMHIIDISGIDISHAAAIAKKFNRKQKLDAIFVDYIQLMKCSKSKSELETLTNISRGLKGIAKDNKTPLVALAQLNRGVEQRTDKRPLMSDLRGTGQIEQDADFISFLYRDEYYNDDSQYKGITELSIRKNREGESGKVFLKSDFSVMRYEELDGFKVQEESSYKPFRS